jgi:serine protease Do
MLLVGTALVTGTVAGGVSLAQQEAATPQGQTPLSAEMAAQPANFADIVERVAPAVVNISTTQPAPAAGMEGPEFGMPGIPEGTPFSEFLRRFFEEQGRGGSMEGRPRHDAHALGSGFIIDPAGYVVTNDHVVGEATEIDVILTDGRTLKATLVGRDSKTDLALLKVEADGPLPYVEFGDSDHARIGEWVLAVGNPFGLGGTVTAGILSARGRDLGAGPFDDFLQIDAPINRGNSGGPTFNLDGEVIGVNSAIFSPSGGSVGIGFAIPASLAQPIVEQLKENGSVERGWLGVHIQQVTPQIADAMGLSDHAGALIADVTLDSPAQAAGLEQGDLIVTFDGKPVAGAHDLPRMVAETPAGTEVPLEVLRGGEKLTLTLEVGSMPSDEQVAAAQPAPGVEQHQGALGLALAGIDDTVRQRFQIPEDVSGVAVVGVEGDGPAAEAGIAAGDVIVEAGGAAVTSPEDVATSLKHAEEEGRKALLLLIDRQGDQRFVAVTIAEA